MLLCGFVRPNVDSPQPRSARFAVSREEALSVLVADAEGVFVQGGGAVGVTEFPQADEVVGESWDDVSCPSGDCGKAGDGELGRSGGGAVFSGGGADVGAWRRGVDVEEWGPGSEVVVRGACVDNGGVVVSWWATGMDSSG